MKIRVPRSLKKYLLMWTHTVQGLVVQGSTVYSRKRAGLPGEGGVSQTLTLFSGLSKSIAEERADWGQGAHLRCPPNLEKLALPAHARAPSCVDTSSW